MAFIRYLLAIALFVTGIFILIQCLLEGFGLMAGCIALGCFVLAYIVKPSAEPQTAQQKKPNISPDWLEWIDFPIELVFRLITLPFRLIGKLFKHVDIDVSPDL